MDAQVAIATVSCRDPKWPYVYDMLCMFGQFAGTGGAGIKRIGFQLCLGSQVHYGRRDAVNTALKDGTTHILWIDDDMTFPSDTLARLLKHDLDFVAANCTSRQEPVWTTAIKDNQRITSIGQTGLMEVDQVGFGVVLTKVDMFRKIPEPWFTTPHDPKGGKVGEDIFFCVQARKQGYKLFIDHDLSVQIGHVGMKIYKHDMVTDNPLECTVRPLIP